MRKHHTQTTHCKAQCIASIHVHSVPGSLDGCFPALLCVLLPCPSLRFPSCACAAMCVYSCLFMRFAWMVKPRNYLLLACHASNETVQLYQLSRYVFVKYTPWHARILVCRHCLGVSTLKTARCHSMHGPLCYVL